MRVNSGSSSSMSEFYAKAAAESPVPSLDGGASGYFSKPADTLDPHLFDGDALKDDVREHLEKVLLAYLADLGLRQVVRWLSIWLAGSGITYQWSSDRGNGDLDVLFGVDFGELVRQNPGWAPVSESQFASWLNQHLRNNLWPDTARTNFHGQVYEVTYYLNPGTGRNVTNIHPYAAYNLVTNGWTVRPPVVPADPSTLYSREWFRQAQRDTDLATRLTSQYDVLTGLLEGLASGSPQRHSYEAALRLTTSQARAHLDDIHLGRHEAFSQQGHGYGDWHNFRWQAAKKSGAIKALSAIVGVGEKAKDEEDQQLYGGHIDAADVALTRAALAHKDVR